MNEHARELEAARAGWKRLYRVGGIAGLVATLFFRRNLGVESNPVGGRGEALLAIHNPSGLYQGADITFSLLLATLCGLIVSLVMLRSSIFGKAIAYVGVAANALGLGAFLALVLAPAFYVLFPILSVPFRVTWYLLATRRLLQLGRRSA